MDDKEIAIENCKNQIVSEKFQKLFEVCRHEGCGAIVMPQDIDVEFLGMYMQVSWNCTTCKNEKFVWETSEKVKNKLSKTGLRWVLKKPCLDSGYGQWRWIATCLLICLDTPNFILKKKSVCRPKPDTIDSEGSQLKYFGRFFFNNWRIF